MKRYRIRLFGGFELSDSTGEIISLPGTQTAHFLAILALNPEQPVSRLKLINYLWEDRDEAQGRSSLRQLLWSVRKLLGSDSNLVITSDGSNIALSKDSTDIDADRFETLAASDSQEDLEQAAELYRGDLLEGIAVRGSELDKYFRTERDRFKIAAVNVLTNLIPLQRSNGVTDQAIASAEKILAIDPASESAHQALMEMLAEQGKKTHALRQYEILREHLRSELDIEPSSETESLYQSIKASQPDLPAKDVPQSFTIGAAGQQSGIKWRIASVVIAVIAFVVVAGFWVFDPPGLTPTKPSIAVLPFLNMSGDPEQEYFTDGITEDLTTDLSKISDLFVISRNSAFSYKGKTVKAKDVAKDLHVRYILEGSVRRDGDQVRINAQLIDTDTDRHLWAERYDGAMADIFNLQDQVTRKIITALAVNLTPDEEARQAMVQTRNPEAYDAFLQGWSHYLQDTRSDFGKAIEFFERAIELDPDYARAHAALAGTYIYAMDRGWQYRLHRCHAKPLAEKHLQLAMRQPNALAYRFAAILRWGQGRHDEAIAEAERAIALDPNDAENYDALGFVSHGEKSIEAYQKAMQLNPHYPARYLHRLGGAYFETDQYELAVANIERARKRNPEIMPWMLMASYGYLGRTEDAAALSKEFYEIRGWTESMRRDVDAIIDSWGYADRRDAVRLGRGLIKAGMCCEEKLQKVLDNLRPDSALFRDIEFPQSYELPDGVTVMNETEIRDHIVGNTQIGEYEEDTDTQYFLSDGTLSGLWRDVRWCDYWAVSGPVLCVGIDSQRYCESLALEGNTLKAFDLSGVLKATRQLVQGNALPQPE